MNRVNGKVAIVTGAARGIGYADALLLAQEGARVVVTDIDEAGGKALAASAPGIEFVKHEVTFSHAGVSLFFPLTLSYLSESWSCICVLETLGQQ